MLELESKGVIGYWHLVMQHGTYLKKKTKKRELASRYGTWQRVKDLNNNLSVRLLNNTLKWHRRGSWQGRGKARIGKQNRLRIRILVGDLWASSQFTQTTGLFNMCAAEAQIQSEWERQSERERQTDKEREID